MSEPIAAGDVVQMVHACCGRAGDYLGWVTIAEGAAPLHFVCSFCGHTSAGPDVIVKFAKRGPFPAAWLKRFPPLGASSRDRDDVPSCAGRA